MTKIKDKLDWSKSFMYQIHQTYFFAEKRLEHRLLAEKGISFSQFLILLGLRCNESASQTEIAQFLYLTEATVSRHITALEKGRYLTRKEDQNNRRKHVLGLTAKGQKAFTDAHKVIEDELKDIFGPIPKKDRTLIEDAFAHVLAKLLKK